MNHIIAVTDLDSRHKLVQALKERYLLKAVDHPELRVVQDKVNRILLYEGEILVDTIVVITIPVSINLDPLFDMCSDNAKFTLSAVFEKLDEVKTRLRSLIENPSQRKKGATLQNIVDRLTT